APKGTVGRQSVPRRMGHKETCGSRSHPFFAKDFVRLRAQSMKSCATGLIIRFFKVMMAIGPGRIGRSTGTAFRPKRLPLIHRTDAGATDRKWPVCAMA